MGSGMGMGHGKWKWEWKGICVYIPIRHGSGLQFEHDNLTITTKRIALVNPSKSQVMLFFY